jgi:hypothetical protein
MKLAENLSGWSHTHVRRQPPLFSAEFGATQLPMALPAGCQFLQLPAG